MFFSEPREIKALAERFGTTIFTLPKDTAIPIKNAIIITNDPKKSTISIEQVREATAHLTTKQNAPVFVIINPADALTEEAANALLKNLEEPGQNTHYILQTTTPTSLPRTILSRAQTFYQKLPDPLSATPNVSKKVLDLSKTLLTASEKDLPALADQIAKHKDNPRAFALEIVATTIELAYKSYFKTNNPKFLQKIPNLINLHSNLKQNGNLKLHIVADLC